MMDFDELDEKEEMVSAQAQPQDGFAAPSTEAKAEHGQCATEHHPEPAEEAAQPEEPSAAGPPGPAEEVAHCEEPPRSDRQLEGIAEESHGAAEAASGPAAATGVEQEATGGSKPSSPEAKHKDGSSKDAEGRLASPSSAFFNSWGKLDTRCGEVSAVKSVAESLNVSPLVVAVVGSFGVLGFLFYGLGGQLLCTILGFLYPAFESFKAAERAQPSVMQFWLMYWVVWSLFVTMEHFCYYFLIWVPFYYPLKLVALVWLFHPATKGARFVYRWFILPVLLRNQEKIDAALEESSKQLKKRVSGALSGAVGAGLNTAMAAGAGAVPRVRSLSMMAMEALLAKRVSFQEQDSD
eukprot:CAMPEP_0171179826 /NCGR_PEP_ID=MMETSP0790-20130122/13451_1 /TAXON_ID=2925 /ORGANISM="Alexandrium catenella, Strain OF101" /LENGTH=350 /DNA_ID=CAMNT_0011644759 /DNA_START=63 /DNA_END=1115 /DNA_ORIENTATION=+